MIADTTIPETSEAMLEKEFEWFMRHQDELAEKYEGRFIVIKGEKVIGDYDSRIEAYLETQENHEVGTFLIQQALPGTDAYTQTFHSRVIPRQPANG